MKTIYISGPMSGIEDLNREAFESAEKKIQKMGHVALNPHRFPEMETYEDYLLLDLEMIALAVLAGMLYLLFRRNPYGEYGERLRGKRASANA